MLMQKVIGSGAIMAGLLIPLGASAGSAAGIGGITLVGESQAELAGEYSSDVVIVAETARLSGNVAGDVFVLAKRFECTGTIGGNLRGVVGETVLGCTIERNVSVLAQSFTQESTGVIAGHVTIQAEHIELSGVARQTVALTAKQVGLGGTLERDAYIHLERGGNLDMRESAKLLGTMCYAGADRVRIADGAVVVSTPEYEGTGRETKKTGNHWLYGLIWFFSQVVLALVLFTLFPRQAFALKQELERGPWLASVLGIAWFVAVPLAALFLLVSLIGIPVAVLLLLLYGASFFIAAPLAGYLIGERLVNRFDLFSRFRQKPFSIAVLGLCLYQAANVLPVIGAAVTIGAVLMAMGAVVKYLSAELFHKTIT